MFRLLIILLVLMTSQAQEVEWRRFGAYEYYLNWNRPALDLRDAITQCRGWYSTLVTLKTTSVQNLISDMFSNMNKTKIPFSFYIGMHRFENTDKFFWTDQSEVSLEFSNWDTGQPSDNTASRAVVMGQPAQKEAELKWRVSDGRFDSFSKSRAACERPFRELTTTQKLTLPAAVRTKMEPPATTTTASFPDDNNVDFEVQGELFANDGQVGDPATIRQPVEPQDNTALVLIMVAVLLIVSLFCLIIAWYYRWKKGVLTSWEEAEAEEEEEEEDEAIEEVPVMKAAVQKEESTPAKVLASTFSFFMDAKSTLSMAARKRFSTASTYYESHATASMAATAEDGNVAQNLADLGFSASDKKGKQ